MQHYQTLGLKQKTTITEIKATYRALALKTHPDKGGDKMAFMKIKEAYEYLVKNHVDSKELPQEGKSKQQDDKQKFDDEDYDRMQAYLDKNLDFD